MKTQKIKLSEMDLATLKTELGLLENRYNSGAIEFKNSKGKVVSCPANLIDRLGNYAGPDRETAEGKPLHDQFMAVFFKMQDEMRKGANNGAELKAIAGSNAKAGTVRIATSARGIDVKSARVGDQVALVQKMAKKIHEIRQELDRRAAAERAAAEAADKAKELAVQLEALMGPAAVTAAPVAVAA